VSYTGTAYTGIQGPALTTFDSRLRPLSGSPLRGEHRIVARNPVLRHAVQFWVQSAVDQTSGDLWMCFYDTAGDPKQTVVHYSCSVSRDGGRTFTRPIRAASAGSDESQPGASQYGYYQGLAAADGVAHPMWTDTRRLADLQEEIYTNRISRADFLRRS